MRKENKRIRKGPDAVKKVLQEYCTEVIKRFKPACIILYGSRAKGTFTGASDFDIIVISSNFEQDFLSRIKDLIDANTSSLTTQVSHSKIENNSKHPCAFQNLANFWS